MGIQIKALKDGQLGTTANGQLYPVPAGKTAIVKSMRFVNTHTSAITINVYYKKKDGTARKLLPANISLAAGAALIDDSEITLEAEGEIQGDASTAAKVDYVFSGVERDVA